MYNALHQTLWIAFSYRGSGAVLALTPIRSTTRNTHHEPPYTAPERRRSPRPIDTGRHGNPQRPGARFPRQARSQVRTAAPRGDDGPRAAPGRVRRPQAG